MQARKNEDNKEYGRGNRVRKQVNYCDDLNDEQFNSLLMAEEGESSAGRDRRGRSRRGAKAEGPNDSNRGEERESEEGEGEGEEGEGDDEIYM